MNIRMSERDLRIAVAGLELAASAVAPPACPDCDFDGGGTPCPPHAEAVEASADYRELAASLAARLPVRAPGG